MHEKVSQLKNGPRMAAFISGYQMPGASAGGRGMEFVGDKWPVLG